MVWTLALVSAIDKNTLECSTPYGINGLDTNQVIKVIKELIVCSTPYGINGLDTPINYTSKLVNYCVLNALRHQWFGHQRDNLVEEGREGCAQRLTASMVWTPLP